MQLKRTVHIRQIMALSMLHGIPTPFVEREEKMLRRIIKRGQVAIDIGANVGMYTLYLSRLVGKEGHVYAFEPFKPTYELLSKTVERKGLENVSCFNNAIGERETQISLEIPKINNRRINDPYVHLELGSEGEIKMICLDDFIRENVISDVAFIKVDVEGYEHFVFEGASETIKRFKPTILTEINTKWTKRYGKDPTDVEKLLNSFGYNGYVLNRNRFILSSVNHSKYENFFFFHRATHIPSYNDVHSN